MLPTSMANTAKLFVPPHCLTRLVTKVFLTLRIVDVLWRAIHAFPAFFTFEPRPRPRCFVLTCSRAKLPKPHCNMGRFCGKRLFTQPTCYCDSASLSCHRRIIAGKVCS